MSEPINQQDLFDKINKLNNLNNKFSNRKLIILVGLMMCMLTIFFFIHEELPRPYMDEEFHVDQLHAYCAGRFTYVSIFLFLELLELFACSSSRTM